MKSAIFPTFFVLAILIGGACAGPQQPQVGQQAEPLKSNDDPESYAWDIRKDRPAPPRTPTLEEARKAIEADPQSPRAQLGMGLALYAAGEFAQAEPYLLRASEYATTDPIKWAARYYLAMSVDGQGRRSEAARLYGEVVPYAPDNIWRAIHHYEAGYLYREMGDYEKAGRHFAQSVEADETQYRGAFGLGGYHAQFGRREEAERYFRLSFKHADSELIRSNCLHALGLLAEEWGDLSQAAKYYEQALYHYPEHHRAAPGLDRMRVFLGVTPHNP